MNNLSILQILGILAVAVAFVLLLFEWSRYRQLRSESGPFVYPPRRRFIRRVSTALLLVLIVALLVLQPRLETAIASPFLQLAYLGICFFLTILVMVLIWRDLKDTGRQALQEHASLTQASLVQLERQLREMKEARETKSDQDSLSDSKASEQ